MIRDVKPFHEASMLHTCEVDTIVAATGLASGRKAGTQQTGGGEESACWSDQTCLGADVCSVFLGSVAEEWSTLLGKYKANSNRRQ